MCVFQVLDAEIRIGSLQKEVDRLTALLSRAQDAECVQREKVQSVSHSLQEATSAHSTTQGRLCTLQKNLSTSEQDRRLLQVRASYTLHTPGCITHYKHNLLM